ncbi:hypothetical protein QBC47DRAFT_396370 [Echria macrotheca]|uniref:Uncharacterized protein n=1 Tax=Echria macrotheca TaxID=438768 RepID=A0AAJ0BLA4_9PEZI|nr:hypothetical protein QBC47DRAFT_396370 [Echria macrotheca]
MRLIIALIFALAAGASAAPSPGLDNRQACVYECGCNSPDDNPPPDTGSCCSSAGGSLGGDLCRNLSTTQARSFRSCCKNGSICFTSGACPLPP